MIQIKGTRNHMLIVKIEKNVANLAIHLLCKSLVIRYFMDKKNDLHLRND